MLLSDVIQQFGFGPVSRFLSTLLINPFQRRTRKDTHRREDSDPDSKLSVRNNRQSPTQHARLQRNQGARA